MLVGTQTNEIVQIDPTDSNVKVCDLSTLHAFFFISFLPHFLCLSLLASQPFCLNFSCFLALALSLSFSLPVLFPLICC